MQACRLVQERLSQRIHTFSIVDPVAGRTLGLFPALVGVLLLVDVNMLDDLDLFHDRHFLVDGDGFVYFDRFIHGNLFDNVLHLDDGLDPAGRDNPSSVSDRVSEEDDTYVLIYIHVFKCKWMYMKFVQSLLYLGVLGYGDEALPGGMNVPRLRVPDQPLNY